MLVVMRAESSQAEIDAVCQRAREAGFEAAVFEAEPGAIVLVRGHAGEAIEQLVGLPGIARMIHPRPPEAPATSNLRIAGIVVEQRQSFIETVRTAIEEIRSLHAMNIR